MLPMHSSVWGAVGLLGTGQSSEIQGLTRSPRQYIAEATQNSKEEN